MTNMMLKIVLMRNICCQNYSIHGEYLCSINGEYLMSKQ